MTAPLANLSTAAARVAEIRAHIRSLSGTGGAAVGVVGNRVGLEPGAGFDRALAEATATAPQIVPTGSPRTISVGPTVPTPTSTAPPVGGPSRSDVPGGPTPGDWATRLPEAGRAWGPAIQDAADRNRVDPALLAALVWTESGFQPDAVSHAGARGLAQLMPATAAGMDVDPDDPAQNLDGGARFLRAMLDRFGSADLALAAYNAGPGRVARAGGIPQIAETQAYVPRVLEHYAHLKGV